MNQQIGLALGSGGARGITQIGVIEVLEENGFQIKEITGTSMGAVVGGIYAAGHLKEFKEWICKLNQREVYSLIDFTISKQGFIKGERVFNTMKKFIPDKKIDALPIPFTAIAADLIKKEEIRISEGNLFEAIRASVAIPSVLTPVQRKQQVLVDGGVINPVPVSALRGMHELTVAVDLNGHGTYESPKTIKAKEKRDNRAIYQKFLSGFDIKWQNYFLKSKGGKEEPELNYISILNHLFDLMQDQLTQYQFQNSKPDILITIPKTSAETFDFFKGDELVEYGRQSAQNAIKKWKIKTQSNTLNP